MRYTVLPLLALVAVTDVSAQSSSAKGSGYAPRLSVSNSGGDNKGRSIRHEIVVLRDVDASSDDKVILVKTVVDQAPSVSTLTWYGEPTNYAYGTTFSVADGYLVSTHLVFGDGTQPAAVIESQVPTSDGATERNITETVRTSASIGVSAAPESLATLALGKLPLSASAGAERGEERSVTMTLKDYSVSSHSGMDAEGRPRVGWRFSLAPDIADNLWYAYSHFNLFHNYLYSAARVTPMMRRATLETAAVWRIPGDYDGPLDVVTTTGVDIRHHGALYGENRTFRDKNATISLSTRVDLGSPHLSRQPVVRLQSLSGLGLCLAQPDAGTPAVVMQRCAPREENAGQQWILDTDLTYRNFGSGYCLTADPLTGGVHAEACAGAMLNQRWEWRADRLHTMYMDDGNWRLHVRDGIPRAVFDPTRHQDIVTNAYHPLLRPWSSYPKAPTLGDVIPSLNTTSPPIPTSFLAFRQVNAEERWQPVPVDASR